MAPLLCTQGRGAVSVLAVLLKRNINCELTDPLSFAERIVSQSLCMCEFICIILFVFPLLIASVLYTSLATETECVKKKKVKVILVNVCKTSENFVGV